MNERRVQDVKIFNLIIKKKSPLREKFFYLLELLLKMSFKKITITVRITLHLKKENCNPAHLTTRSMRATSPHVISIDTIQIIKVVKSIFVDFFINNQVLSYLL